MGGGLGRVRDHEDGLAIVIYLLKETQELVSRFGVERAGRLIGEDELRVCDKRAGDGGALLLSARDLIGVFLQDVLDAELCGNRIERAAHLVVLLAREHQRQEDIVLNRKGVEQIKILKHEAQIVTAEGGYLLLLYLDDVASVEQDLSGARLIERSEDIQKRRLAAAALAHDGDVFALLNREADV